MQNKPTTPQPMTGPDGFPTWLTGPDGERRVFNSLEEVPEGWTRKDGTPVHPKKEPEPVKRGPGRPPKNPQPEEF